MSVELLSRGTRRAHVELSASCAVRAVKGDEFRAEDVVARSDAAGQGEI